jgi:acetolactate synthase I/II/III large subunit
VTFQEPNTERNTAHLIVECLLAEGVEYVFGIPGEENIELIDALSTSNIRYLLTRHEQAASFMAEIYGRLTGRAGVCSATLGPGAINLQLGVADATTNSTPLVALSAQVGLDRIFKESHQAVDLVGLFRPITTWAELVPGPAAVPEMFRRAFKTAQTERPGATYLGVPEDVERAVAAPGLAPLPISRVRAEDTSPAQVLRAARVLAGATAPILLVGRGAARDFSGAAAEALLARMKDETGAGAAAPRPVPEPGPGQVRGELRRARLPDQRRRRAVAHVARGAGLRQCVDHRLPGRLLGEPAPDRPPRRAHRPVLN